MYGVSRLCKACDKFFFVYWNHVKCSTVMGEIDVATIDSLLLTMHITLMIDWLTYLKNILQPSFVWGPFDVVDLRH